MWRGVSATLLAVAGLTALAYAGWVATARRELYASIADAAPGGAGAVSLAAARSSDEVEAAWGWSTGVLVVTAVVAWFVTRVVTGHRFGPVGFTGLASLVVGLGVASLGSWLALTVDGEPALAGRAVLGSVVVGIGLLLVGFGMLAGTVSLLRAPRDPTLGYSGWGRG